MPHFDDLAKRVKRPSKTKKGETPPPYVPPTPVAPATMRVRFLVRIAGSRRGTFFVGQVAELPVEVAKDWIGMGLVEQDKSLDGPPEIK